MPWRCEMQHDHEGVLLPARYLNSIGCYKRNHSDLFQTSYYHSKVCHSLSKSWRSLRIFEKGFSNPICDSRSSRVEPVWWHFQLPGPILLNYGTSAGYRHQTRHTVSLEIVKKVSEVDRSQVESWTGILLLSSTIRMCKWNIDQWKTSVWKLLTSILSFAEPNFP